MVANIDVASKKYTSNEETQIRKKLRNVHLVEKIWKKDGWQQVITYIGAMKLTPQAHGSDVVIN
ncbi:MAG: hypothetical protein ACFFE6_15350 [Candidatus Thorarchaeota archaeon]